MREIPIRAGLTALVDDADFGWLSRWNWSLGTGGYAIRSCKGSNPCGRRNLRMHLEILPAPPGMIVDHWDGDPLNNQQANLRICTQRENSANASAPTGNTSVYRGVSAHSSCYGTRWTAKLKGKSLGTFSTEEEAVLAYDCAAIERYGAFARLNFPKRSRPPGRFITLSEAEFVSGIPPATLLRLLSSGELPGVWVGIRWLVKRDDFQIFLASRLTSG